jgi:hypothetical protein
VEFEGNDFPQTMISIAINKEISFCNREYLVANGGFHVCCQSPVNAEVAIFSVLFLPIARGEPCAFVRTVRSVLMFIPSNIPDLGNRRLLDGEKSLRLNRFKEILEFPFATCFEVKLTLLLNRRGKTRKMIASPLRK